jgi:hypothetical protein
MLYSRETTVVFNSCADQSSDGDPIRLNKHQKLDHMRQKFLNFPTVSLPSYDDSVIVLQNAQAETTSFAYDLRTSAGLKKIISSAPPDNEAPEQKQTRSSIAVFAKAFYTLASLLDKFEGNLDGKLVDKPALVDVSDEDARTLTKIMQCKMTYASLPANAGGDVQVQVKEAKDRYDTALAIPMETAANLAANYQSLLYFDADLMVIMPARPGPFYGSSANDLQPTSLHAAQASARSSTAHLLVLPRSPIFNAATLEADHILLIRKMQAVGTAVLRALVCADSYPLVKKTQLPGNLNAPLTMREICNFSSYIQAEMKGGFDRFYTDYLPGGLDLSTAVAPLFTKDIVSAFQVYPNNSLGYLHMHVFALAGLTHQGAIYLKSSPKSTIVGDKPPILHESGTMTPVDHVVRWISEKNGQQ